MFSKIFCDEILEAGDLIQVEKMFYYVVETPSTRFFDRVAGINRQYLLRGLIGNSLHLADRKTVRDSIRRKVVSNYTKS